MLQCVFVLGKTLWELYSAKVFYVQLKFSKSKISLVEFLQEMKSLRHVVEDAKLCYAFNDINFSDETSMKSLCEKAIMSLNDTIAFFNNMIL